MTAVLILAASNEFVEKVRSIPGHTVRAEGRDVVQQHSATGAVVGLISLDRDRIPEIVILGDGIPSADALSIAQRIDNTVQGMELMLIAEPDTELALQAMRVGIREILPPTINDDDLEKLLHRSSGNVGNRLARHFGVATVEAAVDKSQVIVVLSAKGGVGKSTVAVNLVAGLAKAFPMQTVLVDLDIQFGDAANLLDLHPEHSIADAFGTSAALDSLILKTFLTPHDAGFYVLTGAESPTASDEVTTKQVKRLLQQLAEQFRCIVVDTGAGLTEHTLAALEEANEVVLVSSMDVSSLRALRKENDLLTELELLPEDRYMVLNFVDRRSGLTVRDVETVLGMVVDVSIPRSAGAPVAGNKGEPLVLAKRKDPAAKALQQLVALVEARREVIGRRRKEPAGDPGEEKKQKKKSLWGGRS